MAGSTTNLGLTLPTGGDPPSELRIAITNNANAMDAYSLLTSTVTNAVSASVLRGQSVIASPSTTQTLPAASANAMVAITASSTVTGTTQVTVAGSQIFGLGLANPASSFPLGTPGAFVVLQSDGTHWFIVAGQQDTGWLAISLGTGVSQVGANTPSARVRGDAATMRGSLSGSSITAWGTAPVGTRPPNGAQVGANPTLITIGSSGAIVSVANSQIGLDNITYSIV